MNIKVISSGSSGNCYRIDDGETALLLECGLPIKKIKEGCDFNLSSVSACLVTHEHKDHSMAINKLMHAGVNVWATEGTAVGAKAETYRLKLWKRGGTDDTHNPWYISECIGTFRIKPFAVHHDAAEPVGYVMESRATGERLLFVTDTYYIDYRFTGLTYIMVEANFSADSLANAENDPRRSRLRRSHMSLENCIKMLNANSLAECRGIWLIHLSSSNADAEKFRQAVQAATGCPVYVA